MAEADVKSAKHVDGVDLSPKQFQYFPVWLGFIQADVNWWRDSTVPIRRDRFTEQMFVFLVTLAGSILLQSACVVTKGVAPKILNNGTYLDIKDDDIAHFTCTSRGEPRPLVRWEKEGVTVKDKDEGIAILSKSNDSVEESHLFIAVSGNERRGKYICVASNEEGVAKQSFNIRRVIGKLSTIDIAAIGVSVGLVFFFVCTIGILLRRGANKIKQSGRRPRARTISQSSSSCQENGALLTDPSPDKERNGSKNGSRHSKNCTTSV